MSPAMAPSMAVASLAQRPRHAAPDPIARAVYTRAKDRMAVFSRNRYRLVAGARWRARGVFEGTPPAAVLPEMLVGKSAARARFQVFLELKGSLIVSKREVGDKLPGLVLGRAVRLSSVVCANSRPHV